MQTETTCSVCGRGNGHTEWCAIGKSIDQLATVASPEPDTRHSCLEEALAHDAIRNLFHQVNGHYQPHQMGPIRINKHITQTKGLVMTAHASVKITLIARACQNDEVQS